MTKLFLIVCLYLLYTRCELLSESYLCIIFYNQHRHLAWVPPVVNCFQNRIFALSFTTRQLHCQRLLGCELLSESYLCIIFYNSSMLRRSCLNVVNCFQNRIFALSFTTWNLYKSLWACCELLSESYLCIIFYNWSKRYFWCVTVVNCFQNRIFALSFTTFGSTLPRSVSLWIAFRIVSLHYLLQHLYWIIQL